MASRRTGLASTGAALMLLLAGCGAPPADTPQPSASPTPEAGPVSASEPSVRVPADCTDLVDAGELDSSTGTAVTAVDASLAAPAALEPTAAAQYGVLACAWSTGPLAIDSPVPIVTITVVPGVTAERWGQFASSTDGDDGVRRGYYGADSFVHCGPSRFDGSTCTLDNLVGDYWLSVLVAAPDPGVSPESSAAVFVRATDVVRAIAEPAASRWVSARADASRLDSATVSAAMAASGEFEAVLQSSSPEFGATWLPAAETGMTSVVFSGTRIADGAPTDFTLQVLPSGAWAFAGLARSGGDAAAVDDLGDAAVAYPSPDGTAVVFTVGDDLVLVDVYGSAATDDAGLADATATARAVAAALG